MYETFGNGGANTMTAQRCEPPEGERRCRGRGGPERHREWYRPMPPYKEVVWSMRNNTNYMETGVLSALELTAGFPKIRARELLSEELATRFESGRDGSAIRVRASGRAAGHDPGGVHGECAAHARYRSRPSDSRSQGEGRHVSGGLIHRQAQPAVWTVGEDPAGEAGCFRTRKLRTYDDTGWTMGLMSQAQVEEIADKTILDVAAEPVDKAKIEGSVKGDGPLLAVVDNGANGLATLRYRLKGAKVEAVDASFKEAGMDIPAGSLLVSSSRDKSRQCPEARTEGRSGCGGSQRCEAHA